MKKSNYIFNFQEFMKKLRNDEEKMEIIREYEAACGEIKDSTLEGMPFYKDYLAKFPINEDLLAHIMVPEDTREYIDYDLLLRLVVGSYASDFVLEHCDDTNMDRLIIKVQTDSQSTAKNLDDLWSFQVLHLFGIYILEQMQMASALENPEDIMLMREINLKIFEKKLEQLKQDRATSAIRAAEQDEFRELIS